MADRTDAFVSYSHLDSEWLKRIEVHLSPLRNNHSVVIWQDTHLRAGQRWRKEIDNALAKAKVAILLVSPDFLASDFIRNNELPPLLEAAESDGLTIVSVIVSACAFEDSPLHEFQAINTAETPLDLMTTGEVNKVLVKLFKRVKELFIAGDTPLPATRKVEKQKPEEVAPTIKKSGKTPVTSSIVPVSGSAPLALIVKADGQWETIGVTFSEAGKSELTLTLQPTSSIQRIFLASLHQRGALSSIVYNEQTYPCQLHSLTNSTEGTRAESWKLIADIKQMPQHQDITFNGINPFVQAQTKAELLLLNERPADTNRRSPFGMFNSVSENYVSPLLILYHSVQRDTKRFQQIAPLVATWCLQMTGIVTDIIHLTIRATGMKMHVDFEGNRYSQMRENPDKIKVKGQCEIPEYLSAEALPLRLLKQANQY